MPTQPKPSEAGRMKKSLQAIQFNTSVVLRGARHLDKETKTFIRALYDQANKGLGVIG